VVSRAGFRTQTSASGEGSIPAAAVNFLLVQPILWHCTATLLYPALWQRPMQMG